MSAGLLKRQLETHLQKADTDTQATRMRKKPTILKSVKSAPSGDVILEQNLALLKDEDTFTSMEQIRTRLRQADAKEKARLRKLRAIRKKAAKARKGSRKGGKGKGRRR